MSTLLPQESALNRRHAQKASCDAAAPAIRRFWQSNSVRPSRTTRRWQLFLTIAALLTLPAGINAQNKFPAKQVGASATQNVTVTAQATGTVSSIKVLSAGAAGLDFAAGSGGSCSGAGLAIGGQCSQPVTFTPAYPGVRIGAVVLLSSSNQVIGTALLSGTGTGGLGVLVPSAAQSASVAAQQAQNVLNLQFPAAGTIMTLAGDGHWQDTNIGDGLEATAAELFLPSALAVDGFGNFYIADSNHNRIRMVCSGTNATIAGTSCTAGDIFTVLGGNGALSTPSGVAIDGAGNLYVADTGHHQVVEVSAATGAQTTIAGTGTDGYSGDNGPAIAAELGAPWALALDTQGDLFISDNEKNVIRAVCAAPGTLFGVSCAAAGDIITVVGTGTAGAGGDGGKANAAQVNGPYSVALDPAGNLFVADTQNDKVRAVCVAAGPSVFGTSCTSAGMIFTVTGTGSSGFSGDGGAASQAQLNSPSGLAFDPAGNLYIADTQNNRIRKVNATTGVIITLAGDGDPNFNGYTLPATHAALHGPYGLAFYNAAPAGNPPLAHDGDLLIADFFNQRIRSVDSNLALLTFPNPIRQGFTSPAPTSASDPTLVTVENDGNAPLDLTTLTTAANFEIGTQAVSGITFCANGGNLTVGSQCTVEPIFAPAAAPPLGSPTLVETGNIDINNDTVSSVTAANSPLIIAMTGTATLVNPTSVTVTSTPNPSTFSQNVTFTATVAVTSGTGTPTGSVKFFDGTTQLTTGVVVSGGVATFAISTLTVGAHQITASYSGDSNNASGTSPAITQTVNEQTATTVTSSVNPSALNASVTFTATVTVPNGGGVTPDGTVAFLDGTTTLATVPLAAGGTAQFATASLAQGAHSITAVYSGDATKFINGSTSAALSQDVLAGSTVTLASTPNPSTYGSGVTFTATVTSTGTIVPTGTVTFLDGANQIGTGTINGSGVATATISTLAVGTHTITATYAGDQNVGSGTSNAVTQKVTLAQTGTTLTAAPAQGIAGAPITLTATVAVVNGSATVTGTVTFSNGATNLGSAAVGAGGVAAITPTLGPGNYSFVATYSGDSNDNGSASSALPYVVAQATTQVALTSSGTPAEVLSSVTFKAVVSGNGAMPGGSVAFSIDGTSAGTGTLDSTGTATFSDANLAVGTHSVVATYSGDTNDAGSASSPLSQVITDIPTVTDLGASSTGGATPQEILVATALSVGGGPVPTGTVTFTNGSTTIGSATLSAGGVATLVPDLAPGTYNIVASYGGDSIHSPSQSTPVSISGSPAGFSVKVDPSSLNLVTGQNGTISVTISADAGFSDTIGMGCLSVPLAVNCHFSSNSVALKSGQSQTVQLSVDTNNPLGGGSNVSLVRPKSRGISLAGLFLPGGLLFGFAFWRFRRRHAAVFLVALALLLAGAGVVTGCTASFSQTTAAPGTYTIQVGGIGAGSNTSHYQNVTLTITK